MNKTTIIGNVYKTGEKKDIGNGRQVYYFSISTAERTHTGKIYNSFFSVSIFGNRANIGDVLKEGMQVSIEGKLDYQKDSETGKNRNNIIAHNITILSFKDNEKNIVKNFIEESKKDSAELEDIFLGVNRFEGIGNITKDFHEIEYEGGVMLASSIATTEKYKDANGEMQEKTYFTNFELFTNKEESESIKKNINKGNSVYIEGVLRNSSYEKDGETFYKISCNVKKILKLGVISEKAEIKK